MRGGVVIPGWLGMVALVVFVAAPTALRAQDANADDTVSTTAGDSVDVDLVFEREVFTYPAYQRRNPFTALTGDESGPRFEQLRLMAVIRSEVPGQSIALLGSGSGDGSRSYRVREGQVFGNMRIIRISDRQVMVEVDEFGIRENRTLDIQRPDPESEGPDDSSDDGTTPPPDGADDDDTGADPDSVGTAGSTGVDPDSTGTTDSNGTGGLV